VDDIQYDDSATIAAPADDSSRHPAPAPGRAAIHILTNVIGATAYLGAEKRVGCAAVRYALLFQRTAARKLQLAGSENGDFQAAADGIAVGKPASRSNQKVQLEPLMQGIVISSVPSGADVFINGDKQSGQTPVHPPASAGQVNLVLVLKGFESYSSTIQVRDDGQSKVNAELVQKNGSCGLGPG